MLNYIAMYPNKYEKEFNNEFLMSAHDIPIVDLIITCIREFEAIENIKIEDISIISNPDDYDYNHHTININFKKKDLDGIPVPKNKYITTNRFGEINFKIRVTTNLEEKIINKKILYPIMVDGTFLNNGKTMKPIWQLVDKSTYSQRGKITLKSRMPIIVYHNKSRVIEDVDGNNVTMPSYSYALDTKIKRMGSKKKTKFFNPLSMYMAKMGTNKTIDFFGMKGITYFSSDISNINKIENIIFPVDNVFVVTNRKLFDKYAIVKAFTCMCCNLRCKEFPVEMKNLEDREYWICRIGYVGSAKSKNIMSFREKGITTIYMIERLLDNITINNLRLPTVYKHNIYYLLYWIITNFDNLKTRNNIDMRNKRIRKNEYIVNASLGKKVSENINKLVEKKSKSKLNNIDTLLELFNFNSDIIVAGMRNLNDLIKTDELVNDMNFLTDLAYSAKGPNSIGEGSSKLISNKYRYLHPSMVGVLDLSTSSNSDVGMSGSFTPFVELYDGFYFTPDHEPCDARFHFDKSIKEEEDNITGVSLDTNDFESYLSDLKNKNSFKEDLAYEKILIFEKEME